MSSGAQTRLDLRPVDSFPAAIPEPSKLWPLLVMAGILAVLGLYLLIPNSQFVDTPPSIPAPAASAAL